MKLRKRDLKKDFLVWKRRGTIPAFQEWICERKAVVDLNKNKIDWMINKQKKMNSWEKQFFIWPVEQFLFMLGFATKVITLLSSIKSLQFKLFQIQVKGTKYCFLQSFFPKFAKPLVDVCSSLYYKCCNNYFVTTIV